MKSLSVYGSAAPSRRLLLQGLLAGLSPALTWAASARAVSAPMEVLSAEERAFHALNRLGFGPSPAEVSAMRRLGPGLWLEQFLQQQMQSASSLPQDLQAQLQALETLSLSQAALLARFRQARELGKKSGKDGEKSAPAAAQQEQAMKSAEQSRRDLIRPLVLEASKQRLLRALASPAQLEEVLVDFWFNHFNVYAGKGPVGALVGSYEREAIRPFVFGKFRQMLGAVAKHPAMLIYLDNAQSVGSDSAAVARAQARRARMGDSAAPRASGLNENYARELMELHTLGVDGGYTQRDVTELARILTGWTVDYRAVLRAGESQRASLFIFDAARHDGGSKQWLGRQVQAAGQQEGEMALDVLAAHPATARHLAFKFAQAFVSDVPPPALVAHLAERFLQSQGDLRVLVQSLLDSEQFWSREAFQSKIKSPYRYLISSLRASGVQLDDAPGALAHLARAGMPLYGAATPDGYKNTSEAWMNPEALAQRMQWAQRLIRAGRSAGSGQLSSNDLQVTLGASLSERSRQALASEPADLRLALLLGSPDFMHF
ncbi:DUF1800 family protein [Paucibacter sp. Y2R2-4]|uniref:DUF1800 domain-containing protein n=1 Tax=Paucibacter sp. Y2R2-4 TaxID=2893553 RepID=UPI0021E3D15F|nr:DUF1800 domain-containing protein [Paucibacter sp. Y2R2-4]MCV2348688.1 DUF1800 domain-containing protein [Paucibacter sp. Y2R2-4]